MTGPMSHEPTPVDPDNMILNTNKKNKKKIDTMNTTKPVESNNLCYCHITQIIHNPLFVKMGSITDQILHPTVWLCPLQNMDYIVVCCCCVNHHLTWNICFSSKQNSSGFHAIDVETDFLSNLWLVSCPAISALIGWKIR